MVEGGESPSYKTPLWDQHQRAGGRMVDFAGWSMPVQYQSIVDEHRATRQQVGLFDVSHMGRFVVTGRDAGQLLESMLTRAVGNLRPGRARYGLVTHEGGGILDDVLVYHLDQPAERYLLVVNAANRMTIWNWIEQHRARRWQVSVSDQTFDTAMIAVQGPAARAMVNAQLGIDTTSLANYGQTCGVWEGQQVIASRTGYTGEDGLELILPSGAASSVWERLTSAGAMPAGLGARDTLRLEAAMPLYGHELSRHIDPFQAGLSFAVDLTGRRFPGSDVLRARQAVRPRLVRVGLILSGRRAARPHFPIRVKNETIGEVTSGTFSPTLQQPVAMAYVRRQWASEGAEVEVDIRGTSVAAHVVPLPFYRRESS